MAEKKTIMVTTKPQEVEIEGNLITNGELRDLWLALRGGNADKDTIELLRHLAVNVVKDDEMKRVLHYRAAMLDEAVEKIREMIWPKDKADEFLVETPKNKTETSA